MSTMSFRPPSADKRSPRSTKANGGSILVVRFLPEYRRDIESIGKILVSTPEGARIPLKQLARDLRADRGFHYLPGKQ